MRATDFEFRYRFWIIFGLFMAGFAVSRLDTVHLAALAARSDDEASVRAVLLVGTALVAAGALIRTWATAYLNADVVHDRQLHKQALVADGPYRRLRNPLYLGVLLVAFGVALTMTRLGAAFLVIVTWLYLYRLIRREEAELRQTQGPSYAAYCAAVPSLIPALTPRLPASGARPHWIQAFRGELFVWLYTAAELSYALTFDRRIAITFIAAGFLVNAWEVHGFKANADTLKS
jgi:protein-S-isoprenylcysteine O-methyltransferase Ste14